MRQLVLILAAILMAGLGTAQAQTQIDTSYVAGIDTFQFWVQYPSHYDAANPPAILVWWHGFGSNYHEMRDLSGLNLVSIAEQRGWISAGFTGPFAGRHYQCARGQEHCRAMLDWISAHNPFCRDSIYMIGGSMGGAGGLVWNNNNCGIHDYMCAATDGGSAILDCELRQQQYVDSGHVLVAMQTIFGGFPWENDSIAFQYHRTSAVR
jgi:hypothetical protein